MYCYEATKGKLRWNQILGVDVDQMGKGIIVGEVTEKQYGNLLL